MIIKFFGKGTIDLLGTGDADGETEVKIEFINIVEPLLAII
jgi:hypothetical protein